MRQETKRRQPLHDTATGADEAPVFVDTSGRRLLWLRLALCGVALTCSLLVGALVFSVTTAGATPTVAATAPTTTATTTTAAA